MAEHALKIAEHANVAIAGSVNAIHKIGARKVQALLGDFRGLETQKGIGFGAEVGFDFAGRESSCHLYLLKFLRRAKTAIVL